MRIQEISNIIVIGCGGTGSILIPQLCRFLYSMPDFNGDIVFADGDNYSLSNISRQSFNATYVGHNKAEYQVKSIISNIPNLSDKLSYINKYLSKSDIDALITEGSVVFNCVDNLAARKYVEDRVGQLSNALHVCCGNEKKTGQVSVSVRKDGKWTTPSLFDLHPELNSVNDDRSEMSCDQLASLPSGGQIICANMTAATLALNYFYQLVSTEPQFKNGEFIPNCEVKFCIDNNHFIPEQEKEFVL